MGPEMEFSSISSDFILEKAICPLEISCYQKAELHLRTLHPKRLQNRNLVQFARGQLVLSKILNCGAIFSLILCCRVFIIMALKGPAALDVLIFKGLEATSSTIFGNRFSAQIPSCLILKYLVDKLD